MIVADLDHEGARTLATSFDPTGSRAWGVELDVRRKDSIIAAVDRTLERHKRIDILVNSAALIINQSIFDISEDEWDDVLAVNLRGAFCSCQVVAKHMCRRGWGRIINVASIAGQQGGSVTGAHYAASKAGLIVVTKLLARELAPYGITVNALAPGPIESVFIDSLEESQAHSIVRASPVGRLGTPDEVAAAAAFLASNDAGYITGATLDINGGSLMR